MFNFKALVHIYYSESAGSYNMTGLNTNNIICNHGISVTSHYFCVFCAKT